MLARLMRGCRSYFTVKALRLSSRLISLHPQQHEPEPDPD
jgi:hypothetical protein